MMFHFKQTGFSLSQFSFRSSCNSMVGAIGGEQILNMGPGCQYVGLVLHEFGHAIGYFHEHNRPDRDKTVNILWDNIQYGKNFVLSKQYE